MANETLVDDEIDTAPSGGSSPPGKPPSRPELKRLNINLPATLLEELQQLAIASGKSMTEVVRTALGLVHVAYTQTGPNRRLTISDENGRAMKEIIVPR
jgi:hypothetical protein